MNTERDTTTADTARCSGCESTLFRFLGVDIDGNRIHPGAVGDQLICCGCGADAPTDAADGEA